MESEIGLFEHFNRLLSFGGRESRGSFWPYAFLVVGIVTAANMIMLIVTMASIGNVYDMAFSGGFPNFGLHLAIIFALQLLLYGAAAARRLRDAGFSPLWVLLPVPFAIGSVAGVSNVMMSPFEGGFPDPSMVQVMIVSTALYPLAMIAVCVMLAMPTVRSTGKNRAPPVYHEQ